MQEGRRPRDNFTTPLASQAEAFGLYPPHLAVAAHRAYKSGYSSRQKCVRARSSPPGASQPRLGRK
jgi:hypothetical protein